MTNRTTLTISALCLPVALALGMTFRSTRPWESPDQRAVRVCRQCGLADAKIECLIDTMRDSPASREKKLEAFYATFPKRAHAEPCLPCVEAVLDAAGRR